MLSAGTDGCPYPLRVVTTQRGRFRVTGLLPATPEGMAALTRPAIPQIAMLLRAYRSRQESGAEVTA